MERFGMNGAWRSSNPTPCHGQGHLPLAQVAPSPVQPGLGHFQGSRGSHSFSGQPVPQCSPAHCQLQFAFITEYLAVSHFPLFATLPGTILPPADPHSPTEQLLIRLFGRGRRGWCLEQLQPPLPAGSSSHHLGSHLPASPRQVDRQSTRGTRKAAPCPWNGDPHSDFWSSHSAGSRRTLHLGLASDVAVPGSIPGASCPRRCPVQRDRARPRACRGSFPGWNPAALGVPVPLPHPGQPTPSPQEVQPLCLLPEIPALQSWHRLLVLGQDPVLLRGEGARRCCQCSAEPVTASFAAAGNRGAEPRWNKGLRSGDCRLPTAAG
ncbi:uncharacterized protein LOC116784656 [Chiroxiphia lanceolata]|uniref:uncharacterized protein LOC116784656 n=1 Tax=Chiroxiphia lanceolata TaxID=296741 RepID=UPI0013CE7C90|nr:uncharacterized protein LOC116784656 [Chiroxiphia lanceolata]